MSDAPGPWRVAWAASAARAMNRVPLKVVEAVAEFAEGPLTREPYRVTKALHEPFAGKRSAYRGSYRVMVQIDDDARTVVILDVAHLADVYRPR